MGYSPWGLKELDPTEQMHTQRHFQQTLKHLMNTFLVIQMVKNLPAMETWNLPASAEDKRLRFDP